MRWKALDELNSMEIPCSDAGRFYGDADLITLFQLNCEYLNHSEFTVPT